MTIGSKVDSDGPASVGERRIRFEDLFDLAELQAIQDAFAEATGVASIITDPEGRPLTRPSRFCRLCEQIIRKTPLGCANCQRSDAVLGRMHPQGPILQRCLSGGLMDGGTSICAGDHHVANWLIGQVLDDSFDVERMVDYADVIGADREVFRGALDEVTRMSRDQFAKVGEVLFLVARQLSQLALRNLHQARFIDDQQRLISERRRLEAEREQVLSLETAARQQAEVALATRDEFLSVASHELKTPLTSLLLSVQSMQARLVRAGDLPASTRQGLLFAAERLERQVRKLSTLVNDLLDLTRISGRGLLLQRERVNLAVVVADVVSRLQPEWQRSGSTVEVQSEPSIVGTWDASRIEQVVTNLLSNAVKYGSGRPIAIGLRTDGDRAVLTVRDQGIGIPLDDQERIFQRFARAVSDNHYGGLGLGLWIVRCIVEAHGGTISVQSAPGTGSSFRVELPLELDRANVSATRC